MTRFLLVAIVGALGLRDAVSGETVRLLAVVGFLGGFTTFSAFSLETVQLIERGRSGPAAAYVTASVACAVAAVFIGLMLSRRVLGGVA